MVEVETIAAVVGRNCKRIRKDIGLTQNEFARYARDAGLRWKASTVADFEGGRSSPTFATVLLVSLALQSAAQLRGETGTDTTLPQLVTSKGNVQLNSEIALPADLLPPVCSGQPWKVWASDRTVETEASLRFYQDMFGDTALSPSQRVLMRSGVTEDRLARQLGISRAELADISHLLWQSTFSEERDQRAGPDANPQKKGRVSREMRAELKEALADGDD